MQSCESLASECLYVVWTCHVSTQFNVFSRGSYFASMGGAYECCGGGVILTMRSPFEPDKVLPREYRCTHPWAEPRERTFAV